MEGMTYVGAVIGIALAAFGGSLSIGWLVGKTMEAMSRQPEVAGELRTTMLISIAFIEALALYTLVVALLLVMTK